MELTAEEMFGSPLLNDRTPEELGRLRDRLLADTAAETASVEETKTQSVEEQEATDELPGTVPLSDAGSSAEDGAISDRTSATNAPDRHHRG